MKKVFSLALLFASVNSFFADGDVSNEPVAESKKVVSDKQQNSSEACNKRFFLELGVNAGAKKTKIKCCDHNDNTNFKYRFSFGGTIAPYYVINDKCSVGLEFGVDRTESARDKDDKDIKINVTHFSYLLMLKQNLCHNMYVKVGVGAANGDVFGKHNWANYAKMGFAAKVAFGYNIWKNVDLELGYKYYRINAKKDDVFNGATGMKKIKSDAFSLGVMVRL